MGVWRSDDTVITKAGLDLLAELTGNGTVSITRAVAGADYTAVAELAELTDITHVMMNLSFSGFENSSDGTTYVDVVVDNSSVTEEFFHQQIGLFALNSAGEEVLFLVSQATSPDYITLPDTPLYITHRLFIKYSGSESVKVTVDFSGVVTREVLNAALKEKEDAFLKNSAFNRNFSDSEDDYKTLGKKAVPGGSASVARADHIHPIGTMLKFAENNWSSGEKTNLVADTNTWVMSNGQTPTVWGDYEFEATFTGVWEGFSYFFSADEVEGLKGKNVIFGVDVLEGTSARLELIADSAVLTYLLESAEPISVSALIPDTVTSITMRIIIFSADDLYCKFTGLYLHDVNEEVNAKDEGEDLYLMVRKVLQLKLPETAESGVMYITEKGNLYLGKEDGSFLPLGGSEAV